MKDNLELNENYEKIVSNEEHQANLLVAQLHKIRKMAEINTTSLETFEILLDNLEARINKFKFYNDLEFLQKDLKLRIKKIIEYLEKNKNDLLKIIKNKKDKQWYEVFEIKINDIKNFIVNLKKDIENNKIEDYTLHFQKCHEFIEYLNFLILDDLFSKKDDVMEICKFVLSDLNSIFQLLKEQFLIQNILETLNIEDLKNELISLFSEKNNIDDYIKKNIKISNGLKNKKNQIINEELVFLKKKYDEIFEFIRNIINFLEILENEFEKIQSNKDKIDEFFKNLEKATNQLIGNFKKEDNKNLIPKKFFEDQFDIFLKNIQLSVSN